MFTGSVLRGIEFLKIYTSERFVDKLKLSTFAGVVCNAASTLHARIADAR